ncbi:3-methyl-2-oxobutanoate hydroxymethyltransferase [Anaeromyxobacter paludicola]|uniref:3-methyl-2-oxobutanoate hydroxymethyltransferase n=1 Tax=Anaeromyxobacter paludicola TaxID=2918171 RepID=A0ABM7XES3_9BACT|nr:3-methyl-2-oxobutanoate hydroxymethyltransferase [Anaeromyxobacter paludicola]BDG10383.1 3-methyl-2-oxobutanoate hydroxymethyltransferase [Anaeromyxobacter paludicola]
MSKQNAPPKRLSVNDLLRMKQAGEKIAMVTAYDATMARLVDAAGIDVVLVGDSVGMTQLGHGSTLPVTLDQMIHHCAAVRRGLDRGSGRAHLVCDMPFGSYQASVDEAVKNAMRLVAEGGAEAVKVEGGHDYAEVVRRIVRAGVPVMGHVGLTPQSVHKLGGYVVQGKDQEKAQQLLADARAMAAAGAYAVVLECIPAELARFITRQLPIPTIGIGAGVHCDGQVLVVNDLLGLDDGFKPKFVRRYGEVGKAIGEAVKAYVSDVREAQFPAEEQSFHGQSLRLLQLVEGDGGEPSVIGAPV